MNMVKLDSVQTMSSRDIAELTGKNHADVLRDVRKMLLDLEMDESRFAGVYLGGNGEQRKLFNLDREHTDCLLTGYSAKARMLVIKRWHELETQQAPQLPDFSNPAASARAWAEQYEEKQALQQQLTIAAPAVEFVDKFVHASTGSMGFREVCKLLSVNEATFRKFLDTEKIVYKLHGSKMPYANHLDAGRFEVKAGVNEAGHAYNAYRFTTKGVEWVAGEFAKWKLCGGL